MTLFSPFYFAKKSHKRLVIMGDIIEEYTYEKPFFYGLPPPIRKVMYDERDEEKKKERRGDNIEKARQQLKRKIIANAGQWNCKELFITYTFAENVSDPEQANPMWSAYCRRLNAFLGFKAKYITVIEFQERGAVHYHTIYFNLPFISDIKIEFARLWDNGFIKIISVDNVKYLGSYVAKYLQKGLIDVKLQRRKAYFSSRGLKKPLMFRNEKQIPSMLDDLNDNAMLEVSVHEVYTSLKYGLVVYKQLTKINHG